MREREAWADNLKAFLIILMVLGHGIPYLFYGNNVEAYHKSAIWFFSYSFHMPLFAMVAGYFAFEFTNKYSILSGIKHKLITILLPCIAWGLILILRFRGIPYPFFLLANNWFLWSVFYCSVCILVLSKLGDIKYLLGVLIVAIDFLFPDYLNSIDFKMMWPFFLTGYFLKEKQCIERIKQLTKKTQIAIGVIIVGAFIYLLLFFSTSDDISAWKVFSLGDELSFILCWRRWLINFVGSFAILYIFIFIDKRIRFISSLGKKTLGIYMVQNVIFTYSDYLLLPMELSSVIRYIYAFFISIAILIISDLLVILVEKNSILSVLLLGKQKISKSIEE